MVRVRKIALLGYPAVGKSSLAYRFVEKRFESEYTTTIENRLTVAIVIDGREFELEVYDTMGVTELPNFPDDYLNLDGWILVYSVASRRSFDVLEEIYNKLQLSRATNAKMPLVLVGNKADLQADRQVSVDEGKKLAESFHAIYKESSAKDDVGVADIFKNLVKEIEISRGDPIKPTDNGGCTLL